jgi:methyl-accepting chemotaxis protein
MQEVLLRDGHLEQEALEARTSTLQLRRYEKDYFLNIGAPDKQADYLAKWNLAHKDLVGRLDELDRLVASKEDHETLHVMRDDLASYVAGFEKVGAAVRQGEIATPQAANIAISVYKDAVRRLEDTAGKLGGASDFRMRERLAILQADAGRTNTEMSVTALLAVAVAILMSIRLSRSISGSSPGSRG